jgi:GNAT superfamily N-acetyltransferase
VAAHAKTHLPFVAEVDGYVVGAAWLLVAERVPRNDSLDLMTAILAEARTRDLTHVTVHSGRRAVDFYLRNGFSHDRRLLLREPAAP